MGSLHKKLGGTRFVKALIYFFVGIFSYPLIAIFNRLSISGVEHVRSLPRRNVLFISNHQTYFMDVITFLHIFCAIRWGRKTRLGWPFYLLYPYTRVCYVAAAETMRSSLLTRFFALGGAITVKRTWSDASKESRKGLEVIDTRHILEALNDNWVITFPQGTTTAYAQGRKGTAFCIKKHQPVVIPVVINGFADAFQKKGVKMKKKGVRLTVRFKEPLKINFDDTLDQIHCQVMDAIEQSDKFKPV